MRIENGKLIMVTAGIEEYRLYWTDLADTDMRCGNELKIVRKYFGNRVILGYSFSYETKSVSGILMCSCLSVSAGASFP